MTKEELAIGELIKDTVVVSEQASASRLYNRGWFGTLKNNKLVLSLVEALYLVENKKLKIFSKKKEYSEETFMRRAMKEEKRFPTRYAVFADMRTRGYVVKTALKYGADFRVYTRGAKSGEEHAKWVLYAVRETESFDWRKFAAMMRVAHSVRKTLLVGIVDDESDVTYYDINWTRP